MNENYKNSFPFKTLCFSVSFSLLFSAEFFSGGFSCELFFLPQLACDSPFHLSVNFDRNNLVSKHFLDINSMEEFVEESLKEIEKNLKKIMSSLQRQEKVISSMMGSYSNLHLQTLHQEPITLLQEPLSLPSHQETIIIQEAPSLPTHQKTIILQEQLSLPTPNQTLKINPRNQSILPNPSPIIYKTFKKFTFLDITTLS